MVALRGGRIRALKRGGSGTFTNYSGDYNSIILEISSTMPCIKRQIPVAITFRTSVVLCDGRVRIRNER